MYKKDDLRRYIAESEGLRDDALTQAMVGRRCHVPSVEAAVFVVLVAGSGEKEIVLVAGSGEKEIMCPLSKPLCL